MSDRRLETAVAFVIFNRPEATARVFAAIAQARPAKLLVIADGPRRDRPGEETACAATRAVIDRVDWDCAVLKEYSPINLGLRRRLASGLDWVFDTVEEAIVLEDDCLPDQTFFPFCAELLSRYRTDPRVAHVGGTNHQLGRRRGAGSYYFSIYPHVWGWASWRRAWRHFDTGLAAWPALRESDLLRALLPDHNRVRYWRRILDRAAAGKVDAWSYQWMLACWSQEALSVVPNVNLVSNIGFGVDSTHTKCVNPFAGQPTEPVPFPLVHPSHVGRDAAADRLTEARVYKPFVPRMIEKARHDPKGLLRQIGEKSRALLSR